MQRTFAGYVTIMSYCASSFTGLTCINQATSAILLDYSLTNTHLEHRHVVLHKEGLVQLVVKNSFKKNVT